MRYLGLAVLPAIACLAAATPAFAQRDVIGLFYKLRLAPVVCKWKDAGNSRKLAHTIEVIEEAYAITPEERAELIRLAEADLRSDPASCSPNGIVRPMYNGAIR